MATRRIKAIIEADNRTGPAFKAVAAGIGAIGAIGAAVGIAQLGRLFVGGLVAATKAAGVSEAANVKLARALTLSGQSAKDTLPGLRAHAAALQDLTGADDDAVLANQAMLVSLGKLSGEGLQRATRAALDLSAATGQEMKASFDLVAKAAAGHTSTLSRYGIIIDESIPKHKRFEAALSKIEQMFGGQAQESLRTFEGRVKELEGRFGDLQEVIGGPLREVATEFLGSVLSPFIKDLTTSAENSTAFRDAVFDIAISIAELGAVLESSFGPIAKFLGFLGKVAATEIIRTIELQASALRLLGFSADDSGGKFKGLAARLREIKELGPQVPEGLVAGLAEATGHAQTLDDILTKLGIGTMAALAERANFVRQAFLALESADLPDERAKYLRDRLIEIAEQIHGEGGVIEGFALVHANVLTIDEAIGIFVNEGMAELINRITEGSLKLESLSTVIHKTLREQGVRSALSLGDALVDAAVEGRFAFDEFLKSMLIDLAKAIVRALILQSILSAIGSFGGRGGGGGTVSASDVNTGASYSYQRGGIVGAQHGIIAGAQRGRDSQLIFAQPGEAVLPRQLTEMLLASAGGGGSQTVYVEIGPNLSKLTDQISVQVRRGEARLTATNTAGSRTSR